MRWENVIVQEGEGVLEEEEFVDERWGMGEDEGEGGDNEEDGDLEEDMPEIPQSYAPAKHVAVDPSLPRTQQQDDSLQVHNLCASY
jgi:hypothetical protein